MELESGRQFTYNDFRLLNGDSARTLDGVRHVLGDLISLRQLAIDEKKNLGAEHIVYGPGQGTCVRDSAALVFGVDDVPMYIMHEPHAAYEGFPVPGSLRDPEPRVAKFDALIEAHGVQPEHPTSATEFVRLMHDPSLLGALVGSVNDRSVHHLVGVRPDMRAHVDGEAVSFDFGFHVIDARDEIGAYRIGDDDLLNLYANSHFLESGNRAVEVYLYRNGEE